MQCVACEDSRRQVVVAEGGTATPTGPAGMPLGDMIPHTLPQVCHCPEIIELK